MNNAYCNVSGVSGARPIIREYDLFPSSRPSVIQFPNGSLDVGASTTVGGSTINVTFIGSELHGGSTNYAPAIPTAISTDAFAGQFNAIVGSNIVITTVLNFGSGTVPGTLTSTSPWTLGGITLSSGSFIKNILTGTLSVDPGAVNAAATLDVTVSISSPSVGDICSCQGASLEEGLSVTSMGVPSNGDFKIRFLNTTILAINPAAQVIDWICIRR